MRRLDPALLLLPAVGLFLAAAIPPTSGTDGSSGPTRTNVLVILADDLGVDMVPAYGIGGDLPSTPVLDALAARGLRFDHVWSHVNCSPTRATIQTGRYGQRTGIGSLVLGSGNFPLQPEELLLPEALDLLRTGYAHAAIGKWHLGNELVGGAFAPNLAGYDHFAGVEAGVGNDPDKAYFEWTKVVDGSVFTATGYATSDKVDDAIAWTHSVPEPWFCYLAFNTPHAPFHAPPAALHGVDLSMAADPRIEPRPYYKAMVEAMDTEIGRLLAELGPMGARTTVVFLGDNGTPQEVTVPPSIPERGKGSLYEGGIRVPMIVSGPLVETPGAVCDALVTTSDVYATVLELAGGPVPGTGFVGAASSGGALAQPATQIHSLPDDLVLDSISFAPYFSDPHRPSIRRLAYSELFTPNGLDGPPGLHRRAIRGPRFKLFQIAVHGTLEEAFFDLRADPLEATDLLQQPGGLTAEQHVVYERLVAEMDALAAH